MSNFEMSKCQTVVIHSWCSSFLCNWTIDSRQSCILPLFKCHIWNVEFQMSNVFLSCILDVCLSHAIWQLTQDRSNSFFYFKCQIPNAKFQMSKFKGHILKAKFQKSNLKCQISSFLYETTLPVLLNNLFEIK